MSRGADTRQRILDLGLDIASAEGLEGLSIGGLAREAGMSKAGLFAHFGSKEQLQLAVVQMASENFFSRVQAPLRTVPSGIERLHVMLSRWMEHVETNGLRGGCFFFAVSAEFDDRPGPVRDEVARLAASWMKQLRRECRVALRLGHVSGETDPMLLAFQLHAYPQEANWSKQLLKDPQAFAYARAAVDALLLRHATEQGVTLLEGLVEKH